MMSNAYYPSTRHRGMLTRLGEERRQIVAFLATFGDEFYDHRNRLSCVSPSCVLSTNASIPVTVRHNDNAQDIAKSVEFKRDVDGFLCRVTLQDSKLSRDVSETMRDGNLGWISPGVVVGKTECVLRHGRPVHEIHELHVFELALVDHPRQHTTVAMLCDRPVVPAPGDARNQARVEAERQARVDALLSRFDLQRGYKKSICG